MTERTIIVAGASGVVGSALVERLVKLDYRVHALYRPASRNRRARPPASDRFKPVEITAFEPALLKDALRQADADLLVNCAAAGVDPAERQSDQLWNGNVRTVAALMQCAADLRVPHFIHTGSEAEYARGTVGIRIAEDHPILPFSEYGAAKAASVCYASALAATLDIKLLILRPFYLFAPTERKHRLMAAIAAAKALGQPVAMSRGEQQRDFIYIDDAVDAYVAAIEGTWPDGPTVYNVCSGIPRKLRDVAELAARMLDLPASALHWGALPDRQTDSLWIVGDPRRIETAFGWKVSLTLEQGIERWISGQQALRVLPYQV